MDLITLAMAKKYTRDQIAEAATGEVDLSEYAKTSYVDEKVAEVVNTAPEALNTLNELAAALGNDENFATTVTAQIGGKVDKVDGKGLSTNDFTNDYKAKIDSALQSYTESDPTVPAWAKAETKPVYTATEVGAVPITRTVNNKALSANIALSAADVGALPSDTTLFSGNYNDLTNKPTIPSISGLATEDYVDNAIANKEFILNSTTEGSTKKYRVTVDDSGTLTAVEITE